MLEGIRNSFYDNKRVIFKIYGVEYTIEDINNSVIIYQTSNNQRIKSYNSIDDLLNNYTIYGETIKDNEKYIEEIEREQILNV